MKEEGTSQRLESMLGEMFSAAYKTLEDHHPSFDPDETGRVVQVAKGIARINGLPNVRSDELVRFPGDRLGIAFNLEPGQVSVVMLDRSEEIETGMEVKRTGRIVDVPVGEALLGRVINPLGRPLDNGPEIETGLRYPVEREAPAIMDRAAVSAPLQTGILAIDAMIPIGRGQRELIFSDRQLGKTAIIIDTIINQKDKDVICVYCSIGQQGSGTAKTIADLKRCGAFDYTVVVSSAGDESPGLNFIAPYAATAIAEYFMEKGKDVLVVYDDLSRHARSYRELSLLLRRPPAREAFPGDIFYIHSRMLERATHLTPEKGGGSITALPVVETEAQNIAAYIPTNLVSITDGQIYLTPKLFQEGVLPAIDVGRSVSRVGGNAQLPAYRAVAGDLKLAYAQFEELEIFERFSTRLDEETKKALERGHIIREVLRQPQYSPIPVAEQIALLLAVTEGTLDSVPLSEIGNAGLKIRQAVTNHLPDICSKILSGGVLTEDDKKRMLEVSLRQAALFADKATRGGDNGVA
ncbi:F1 sector of membrane-bound ATP synthase, alpha subunit [uncultured Desulfobacterium sp.]|uniref:ATP synthase subunit alpha n=1 Tax=uncultured Desulfobacterium sp. TaxID=201089 RepID=A0A445MZP8_9BACT|nr:F1 sector of membrane-bound ATP synthase, alpha subunit [uncultured Desulfobacterium sp.]